MPWRLCLHTSGIYRFGPELLERERTEGCSRSSGPGPALELRPRRALSSVSGVGKSSGTRCSPAIPDKSLAN
jgi:hypothetical protein